MAKVPGADLVVAGGPPRDDLRGDLNFRRLAKLADSLGVSGQVTFAGQVGRAALPPLLRSADLLVSVSEYDPSGSRPSRRWHAAPRSSPPPSAARWTR